MNPKLRDQNTDLLFEAVLQLRDADECRRFFEDICTVPELRAISQRIVVAKMLLEKRVYNDIVAQTGASTATISRVNRSLANGCDSYEMLFARMAEKERS